MRIKAATVFSSLKTGTITESSGHFAPMLTLESSIHEARGNAIRQVLDRQLGTGDVRLRTLAASSLVGRRIRHRRHMQMRTLFNIFLEEKRPRFNVLTLPIVIKRLMNAHLFSFEAIKDVTDEKRRRRSGFRS